MAQVVSQVAAQTYHSIERRVVTVIQWDEAMVQIDAALRCHSVLVSIVTQQVVASI